MEGKRGETLWKRKQTIKIWYDKEGDYLEVLFERKEGYFKETEDDALMEKVDKNGFKKKDLTMRNIKDIKLKKSDRIAVQEAGNILRKLFPVEKIILFGSKTRGDDDLESDIDLLILTSRCLSWRERKAITYALFDVEIKYDVVISVLITSTKEWSEGPFSVLPIYDEILQYGAVA